jgi:TonB family protein
MAAVDEIALPDGSVWTVAHPDADGVTRPMAIADERIQPLYPMIASPLGEEATILAAIVVDEEGQAQRVEIVDASHPGLGFEDSAAHALFRWKFDPATDAVGNAVMSYAYVRLRFPEPRRGRSSVRFGGGGFSGGLRDADSGFFGGRSNSMPSSADLSGSPGTPDPGVAPANHDPQREISTTGRSGNYPSQGQLYFRGHPEWGNLLYGGRGTREEAE